MSKKFDVVTIILMVILIIALFFVVFNYFTHSNNTVTTDSHLSMIDSVGEIKDLGDSDTVVKNNVVDVSGESQNTSSIIDKISSGEIMKNDSGDGVIDTVYTENETSEKDDKTNVSSSNVEVKKEETPLILTSNDNISDKEKKEVLKELDQTLMDLLDVIDSVQTIDESRLMTDESEVQQ